MLVISQLALSVILLVGALLLIRSYQQLQQVDLGFEPDHVLTFSVSVPAGRQPDAAAAGDAGRDRRRVSAATPGVEIAGAMSNLPLRLGRTARRLRHRRTAQAAARGAGVERALPDGDAADCFARSAFR